MKTPLLSLILFLCSLTGFSQEPVEVMVLMKDQYNRTELCQKAEYIPTRTARRDYVVKELQTFAEASQYDLMLTLNELELQGLVTKVHSLWSANALYFTAWNTAAMPSVCPWAWSTPKSQTKNSCAALAKPY